MASACVNNVGISPENFLDGSRTTYSSYGWLKLDSSAISDNQAIESAIPGPDLEALGTDFEFRLEDPVTLIPADELFLDGKLMPLQILSVKSSVKKIALPEIDSPGSMAPIRAAKIANADPYLFSPRAPRCSSRWREILGLKKGLQQNTAAKNENQKTDLSSSTKMKSLKQFLHSKLLSSASLDSTLSHPLLKDLDCESVSISSSRLSLSSSSSSHEHDDLPRLSLDSDKPTKSNQDPNPMNTHKNRVNPVKPRTSRSEKSLTAKRAGRSPVRRAAGESGRVRSREVSMDSPRMNSSGKIVFQSLERSSSSPSSFNGRPKMKHSGIERSYSANVRVTPVLNVPVSSLRGSSKSASMFGFGQLFSAPLKRTELTPNGGNGGNGHRRPCRNRIS